MMNGVEKVKYRKEAYLGASLLWISVMAGDCLHHSKLGKSLEGKQMMMCL